MRITELLKLASLCAGLSFAGLLFASPGVAADLTVTGALTVNNVIGSSSVSLGIGDAYGFVFEVENATYER